ncbi:MAG TPA: HAD-IIA family hydrolase [Acidimicrobiales bacterium]|nr:HAD-IIA family hydrolase [Acidimicrobiales bacterium]
MAWIFDLDGVLWLGGNPIAGSADAVAKVRDAGHQVLFLTNNSSRPVSAIITKLGDIGIAAEPDEVVTSAQAAASLLDAGTTALVCAGVGVREALEARGVKGVDEGDADAVIVGYHEEFDYHRLTVAYRAVCGGARLIGTNDDATYPTPDGPIPGGGAILAAVTTATGREAEVAGKPYQPMAELVRQRLGDDLGGVILVGDRPSTDGLMARRLDVAFALVLTGVAGAADVPEDPAPEHVADDLRALVDELVD